jgi:hypothetical protein
LQDCRIAGSQDRRIPIQQSILRFCNSAILQFTGS